MPTTQDAPVDINKLSIKEVQDLVGQEVVDVRVENRWVVCVFSNNLAVKIKRNK